MVSALDRAKRALVALIRTLAVLYGCAQNLTREASDSDVKKAPGGCPQMGRVCLGFAQAFAQGFACGLGQNFFSFREGNQGLLSSFLGGRASPSPSRGWGGGRDGGGGEKRGAQYLASLLSGLVRFFRIWEGFA